MTSPTQENQSTQQQVSDKELNFRALEARYTRELEAERSARIEAERKVQERMQIEEPDDDSEPYVDNKKLKKQLAKFGQSTQGEISKAMESAKMSAKDELRQEMWLENNPDFEATLKHAEKFAETNPKLAETILRMPPGFERQKLVYQNIKALGIDKPKAPEPNIQDTIDKNRRSPYYQPSGTGSSPYAAQGDFTAGGKEQAYKKMQELKSRLRI